MRYRRIAGTEIDVSEVGFGVWTVSAGWWGEYSDEQAVALMRDAADRGVTFFDTADTYGNGRGETIVGKAFPGSERDRIVIGTKFGYDWQHTPDRREGHQEAPHRFDIPFLEAALDQSLQRLGTDYIDVWQMHNVRMEHLKLDEVWTFLDRVKASGKVRSLGVALGPAIGWSEEGVYALNERPIDSLQMIYNALELDPGRELIEAAHRTGRSLVVRVPHSSGMLEGHYTADTVFPEGDHRRHRPRAWLINGVQKIEQLDFLKANGSTLGQAALRWVLHDPAVVCALPNIYDAAQLEEFVAASDCPDLTPDDMARVEALFEANYGLPRELEQAVAR